MADIQEFTNRKGQSIGRFNFEDFTFRKKVKISKHLFRMRDSWGIDKNTFDTLRELKCKEIRIWEEESNRIYAITFAEFYQHSILDKWGDEDHQFFCQRQHFKIEDKV